MMQCMFRKAADEDDAMYVFGKLKMKMMQCMFRKAADEDDEKNKLEEDLEELRMDNLVLQNQV